MCFLRWDELTSLMMLVKAFKRDDWQLAESWVVGAEEIYLNIGYRRNQKGRATSIRASIEHLPCIWDTFHAKNASTCPFAFDWLDANLIAYAAFVLFSHFFRLQKALWSEWGALYHLKILITLCNNYKYNNFAEQNLKVTYNYCFIYQMTEECLHLGFVFKIFAFLAWRHACKQDIQSTSIISIVEIVISSWWDLLVFVNDVDDLLLIRKEDGETSLDLC